MTWIENGHPALKWFCFMAVETYMYMNNLGQIVKYILSIYKSN